MILIIGCGNTLRGDDGVGQVIVERFDPHRYGEVVEIIACHQLMPELVEPVSCADLTIFIDAAEGDTPGQIRCSEVLLGSESGAFTHNLTPASLLAGAANLYGTETRALIISITGAQYEFSEIFSSQIEAAVPAVMNLLSSLIDAEIRGIRWQNIVKSITKDASS